MNNILTSTENSVLTITLSRPQSLNALTFAMINTVAEKIRTAGDDPGIRAILIRGEGKSFCAGDDLVDMGTDTDPVPTSRIEEYHRGYPTIIDAIRSCPKPVIAAIHGYTLGAGLEIALAADLILAESETKIGLPFILRGFSSGTTLLPRLSNRIFASRLLFTGEIIPCTELERFGLIHSFAPMSELQKAAAELAAKVAQLPTLSIGLMKAAMQHSETLDERSSLYLQAHSTVSSAQTRDFVEGKAAFAEKRTPSFEGQ